MTPDEQKHLRALLTLLDSTKKYEPMTQDRSNAWTVQPRSSLSGDDAKSHPHEVSQGVWHALTVSVDHFQCLRSSLVREEGKRVSTVIHMNGQYSLIRGALENAARALWILQPGNRIERLTRRFRLTYKEISDSHKVRELLNAPTNRTREARQQQVVDLLVAATGIPQEQAVKALKQPARYKDIVRDAGAGLQVSAKPEKGADVCEAAWSACSSLAHGDALGTLNFLDREVLESDGRIALVSFTGSIPLLAQTTFVAVKMLDRGFQLFRERATTHI